MEIIKEKTWFSRDCSRVFSGNWSWNIV